MLVMSKLFRVRPKHPIGGSTGSSVLPRPAHPGVVSKRPRSSSPEQSSSQKSIDSGSQKSIDSGSQKSIDSGSRKSIDSGSRRRTSSSRKRRSTSSESGSRRRNSSSRKRRSTSSESGSRRRTSSSRKRRSTSSESGSRRRNRNSRGHNSRLRGSESSRRKRSGKLTSRHRRRSSDFTSHRRSSSSRKRNPKTSEPRSRRSTSSNRRHSSQSAQMNSESSEMSSSRNSDVESTNIACVDEQQLESMKKDAKTREDVNDSMETAYFESPESGRKHHNHEDVHEIYANADLNTKLEWLQIGSDPQSFDNNVSSDRRSSYVSCSTASSTSASLPTPKTSSKNADRNKQRSKKSTKTIMGALLSSGPPKDSHKSPKRHAQKNRTRLKVKTYRLITNAIFSGKKPELDNNAVSTNIGRASRRYSSSSPDGTPPCTYHEERHSIERGLQEVQRNTNNVQAGVLAPSDVLAVKVLDDFKKNSDTHEQPTQNEQDHVCTYVNISDIIAASGKQKPLQSTPVSGRNTVRAVNKKAIRNASDTGKTSVPLKPVLKSASTLLNGSSPLPKSERRLTDSRRLMENTKRNSGTIPPEDKRKKPSSKSLFAGKIISPIKQMFHKTDNKHGVENKTKDTGKSQPPTTKRRSRQTVTFEDQMLIKENKTPSVSSTIALDEMGPFFPSDTPYSNNIWSSPQPYNTIREIEK